jgi:hypothetical protein
MGAGIPNGNQVAHAIISSIRHGCAGIDPVN